MYSKTPINRPIIFNTFNTITMEYPPPPPPLGGVHEHLRAVSPINGLIIIAIWSGILYDEYLTII